MIEEKANSSASQTLENMMGNLLEEELVETRKKRMTLEAANVLVKAVLPPDAIIDDENKTSPSGVDTISTNSEAYYWFNDDGLSECEEAK